MHADGVETQEGYKEGDMVGRKVLHVVTICIYFIACTYRKDECDVKESVMEMVS